MTKTDSNDFARLLAHGFGRVVTFLRSCGDARPWRETILDACFHDQRFDHQCEDERGPYLFQVVRATGEPDFYAARIRERLLAPRDEDDRDQLFDLAAEFARAGDADLRTAMYAAFERGIREESDPTGAFALIELDGVAGFVFVMRHLATLALPDRRDWYPDHALFVLEDVVGDDGARAELDRLIADESDLAPFLTRLRDERAATRARAAERRARSTGSLSYQEVRRWITEPGSDYGGLARRMRTAKRAVVKRLARELLAETDRERLLRYLRLFRWHPFPLDPARLITLARDDADARLANDAVNALEPVRRAAVRAFALELLDGTRPWLGARLLARNYEPADLPRLERLAARDDLSPVEYHALSFGIRDCFEANPTPDAAPVLLTLYERGPCSTCRASVFQLLRDVAAPPPPWLIAECHFDADEGLRELAKSEEEAGRANANKNANRTD